MGLPPPDPHDIRFPGEPRPVEWWASPPPPPQLVPRRESWRQVVLAASLFVITLVTTTVVGALHYVAFESDFGDVTGFDLFSRASLAGGLWYSLSIIAILGCHELGHYFACRYYRVESSLPYFIPAPIPLTGTLGAVIRIRQPIPRKRELFDIGIAGPIAGFLVAVPLLLMGISMSRVVALPADFEGLELGEPLLFQAAAWLFWGTPPEGYSINMHPMAFAAWFGLLATALNLFPIGQLDGGHISYAVLGRGSTIVTLGTVACLVGLTVFVSMSWLVWAVLTVAMLFVFGPSHPRTYDEHIPLDRTRVWLAVFALAMFIVCFTPAPIEPFQLIGR